MRSLAFIFIPISVIAVLLSSVMEFRAHIIGAEAVERMQSFQRDLRVAVGIPRDFRSGRRSGASRNFASGSTALGVDQNSTVPGSVDVRGRGDGIAGAAPYIDQAGGAVLSGGGTDDGPRALELEGKETLELASRATESLFGRIFGETSVLTFYANLMRVLAEGQVATGEKLAFYCDSLSATGEVLRREPRNARALMQWANVRQILGSLSCNKPLTDGDFKSALATALELDPTDSDAQYAAGLILRWGQAMPEAAKLFYRVLRYHPRLTSAQERQIYGSIDSPERLREIVPARFPQVVQASRYFLNDPYVVRRVQVSDPAFKTALSDLQREALGLGHDEYARGLLPFSMHLQRMTNLSDVAASPEVRQELDRQLAILLRRKGDAVLAQYLSERATWKELEIVPTTLAGDTRPLKTPLVDWDESNSFFADEFYRSIGFFLPEGQGVQSIELSFSQRPMDSYRAALRVYVSPDNQNWTEIDTGGEGVPFSFGSKHLVAIRTAPRGDLYWKVHFANAARERRLLASVTTSVRVFGISARGVQSGQGGVEASGGLLSGSFTGEGQGSASGNASSGTTVFGERPPQAEGD